MFVTTKDGIKLYYETAGETGTPILFIHEFGGNYDAWEPQMNFFPAAIAASPMRRAVTHRPIFRQMWNSIRRLLRPKMRLQCSMASASKRRISSDCRWAVLRPCISVFGSPSGRCR